MKRILIAEDDKFIANAYRVKLAKVGFELAMATDGEEVIRVLNSGWRPDLIILDVVMPKKDGFAVLAEMKKNEQWKRIPVIVASNLGQKEDIDRGRGLGAVDYIVKSDITMEGLVKQINSILRV